MFPMTADDEVPSPSNESALPVSLIGNDVESVPCFELRVVWRSEPPRLIAPANRFVVEAYVNDASEVEEFVNVWSAVHVLAFAVFSVTFPFRCERPPEKVVVAPE